MFRYICIIIRKFRSLLSSNSVYNGSTFLGVKVVGTWSHSLPSM